MGNSWFRMYAEFATDPKVQMMSEAYQRRFIMLLCIRCGNDHVTLQDEEVAFQLRISNDEWTSTKAVFLGKNLINDDNTPTAWDKRQFRSDSSAERVRKHREAKKSTCNVTVTAPDTEADTEADIPPKTPSESSPPAEQPQEKAQRKTSGTPQRGCQLPADFYPDATGVDLAESTGVNLAIELPKFADHHRAKGSVMKDWQAAWRTWARNSVKFSGPAKQAQAKSRHTGFESIDYRAGVGADGRF